MLAKFLENKYNQNMFIDKIKAENNQRNDITGTDFAYADAGY